ncbi:HEXXH motif domain-containing protein [Streptomyces sp. NPDC004134]|uniref:HEXXH motif domain-containing protein n=1 Tax=Streptomyces sp. NPDC004134 TaxID=3364691 RepID=UPI003690818F
MYAQLAAGGGDRETARLLGRAQRSKRLLLLRMVHDAIAEDPAVTGRLPAPAAAWELLTGAQRADAAAFDAVLMHPSTGVWASGLLRRLRGVAPDDVPLWVEAGHLHTLAAAAAIRAGTDFEIKVPVRDGRCVHLPSLGTVTLPGDLPNSARREEGPGSPGIAGVRRAGGSVAVITPRLACVLLPDDVRAEARGWRPTPAVQATAGTRQWSVGLDDADPYGPFTRGREVPRLSPQRLRSWRSLLDAAWELLSRDQPELAGSLAETMRSLVPLAPAVRGEPYSASSPESYGSAMVGLPRTPTSLAVALVHEFQHVKLGALLDLASLCRRHGEEVLYAPWRTDPRPAAGVLQGVYAHVGITAFWRGRRRTAPEGAASLAHFEFALWRKGTLRALDELDAGDELTDLGRDFVARLRAVVAPWCEESVPEREAADAWLLATDHRAMWRLRNAEPPADAVGRLARAWAGGREGPGAAAPELAAFPIRAGVLPGEQSHRARLVKSRWHDPDEFAWWSARPERSGAPAADVALVERAYAAAALGYTEEVRQRPEASSPWVGLGLALAGLGEERAAAALLTRPELVRAVWLHDDSRTGSGAGASPVSLAEWLGAAG